MKITISIPVYLNNDLHVDFTQQTINSIPQTKHSIDLVIVNNYCAPAHLPFLDSLSKDHSATILKGNDNSVSSAWNIGIEHNFDLSRICSGR